MRYNNDEDAKLACESLINNAYTTVNNAQTKVRLRQARLLYN